MSTLSRLWAAGRFPIRDGLYLADGHAWSAVVEPPGPGGSRLALGEPFDLEALLAADPDGLTSFVVSKRIELAGGGGSVFCGEGSWGSEGLFGRLSADGEPVWVVYLGLANPFTEIEIEFGAAAGAGAGSGAATEPGAYPRPGMLRFRSTSGVVVALPMCLPAGPGTGNGTPLPPSVDGGSEGVHEVR